MNQEVTFNLFKKETHHKKVKFVWTKVDDSLVKEFYSDKFYCNSYSKDMLSLPKFLMSKNQKWYKVNESQFLAISDHGKTRFEIIQEIKT